MLAESETEFNIELALTLMIYTSNSAESSVNYTYYSQLTRKDLTTRVG